MAFLFTFSTQTFAVDFTVNLTTDQHDANTADGVCDIDLATAGEQCSLRAAVEQANNLPSNDRVLFSLPANSTITLMTANGGEIAITNNGTLEIIETATSNLRISGNNTSRVFFVNIGANLTINGVTITNGNGTGTTDARFNGSGGGIYNYFGTVTLTNSTVSGNTANVINGSGGGGGGIYNTSGTVTLTNSTVSGNTANFGGGIFNPGGTMTLTNSMVSGNTANLRGGGIYNFGDGIINTSGTVTLTNSTVSGNTSNGDGGGIYNDGRILNCNGCGTMTLTNSTVSGNTTGDGGIFNLGTLNLTSVTVTNNRSTGTCITCAGGISNSGNGNNNPGTANLNNTIVAGNTAANASAPLDFGGPVSSTSSYNIIGNNQGTIGITNGTNGNQVGTPANPINPLLAPLANNGGATQTHALLVGSPAIDAGNNALTSQAFDQRGTGFPRIVDGDGNGTAIVDVGAYEAPLGTTAATVSISGRVTAGKRYVSNAVVHLTHQNGETQTARTNFFGYYSFKDIAAGETYIINVYSKRYQFNPQVVNLTEDLDELNFTAQ